MKTIRTIIRISLSATLVWVLCGCNDPEPAVTTGGGQPVDFIPSIAASAQVSGAAFDEGAQVGLFCVEAGSDPAAAIAGERYIDNKLFTMTSGQFKSTTPCFWATEYSGPSDFYAYYPYRSLGIGAGRSVTEIGVSADQRADEAFRQCDWMLARAQQVVRSKDPVRLDFKRLMSRLDFVLVPGEGYNAAQGVLGAGLQVLNVARVANVDFTTGEVSSPAIFVNVTPHGAFRIEGGMVVGVSAVIVPQTVKAGAQFVIVNIGERKFRFVTGRELTFVPGKRYTFTLTVSRTAAGGEVKIQPEIGEWVEGTSSSGGTVVVDPDDDATAVFDIDGNEYGIVTIGAQKWLGANLRTTHFNDGSPITYIEDQDAWAATEDSEAAAYCHCENNPDVASYGLLYNWHATHTGKLCPEGWRIPSRDDWDALAAFLGADVGESVKSTSGWHDTWGDAKPEYQGTNSSGFNAMPTGYRKWNKYEKAGVMTTWWTTNVSTMSSLSAHYARVQGDNKLLTSGSAWGKESGCSVRCIKAAE